MIEVSLIRVGRCTTVIASVAHAVAIKVSLIRVGRQATIVASIAHPGGNWWTPHVDGRAMPELNRRFGLMMDSVCRPREPRCTAAKSRHATT